MARRIGVASRFALFAAALALGACARHEVAHKVVQPRLAATAKPSTALLPIPIPQRAVPPSATPTMPPVRTAAPAAKTPPGTPDPAATSVMLAPDAPPQIYSVQMQSQVLRSGETASGTVITSSNVASVEARVAGYGAAAARTAVGRFALSYRVPDLPLFLKGRSYTLQVIARNARGVATEKDLPVTLR